QLQKKGKTRKEQDVFVIEGIKMYEEAPRERTVKVYVSESFYHDIKEPLIQSRNPLSSRSTGHLQEKYFNDIPFEVVKDSVFKEISDTMTPQGIMAIIKKQHYTLDELFHNENANLVILEDIRDPG